MQVTLLGISNHCKQCLDMISEMVQDRYSGTDSFTLSSRGSSVSKLSQASHHANSTFRLKSYFLCRIFCTVTHSTNAFTMEFVLITRSLCRYCDATGTDAHMWCILRFL